MFMKRFWKDLTVAVILSSGLIYLYIDVGMETYLINRMLEGYPTMARPAFWPRFMIVGLLVTSLLQIYFNAKKKEAQKRDQYSEIFNKKVLGSILAVVLYTFFSQYLGYAFSTIIFILGYMWYLGERKARRLICFPILSTLILLLFFWRIMYLALPKGTGIFLIFSNFIMSIVRYGA